MTICARLISKAMGPTTKAKGKHVKAMRPRKEILYKSCDGTSISPKGAFQELEKKRTAILLEFTKKNTPHKAQLKEELDILVQEIEVCRNFLRREAERSKKNRVKDRSPMEIVQCNLRKLKYPEVQQLIKDCEIILQNHSSRFYYRNRCVVKIYILLSNLYTCIVMLYYIMLLKSAWNRNSAMEENHHSSNENPVQETSEEESDMLVNDDHDDGGDDEALNNDR